MTQREEFEAKLKLVDSSLNQTRDYPYDVETDDYDDYLINNIYHGFKMGVEHAKAQGVPQWIPVSERLPDEGVLCIVFGVNGVVNNHFEYYKPTHIQGYFDSVIDGCVLELDEVTHWMPLPAPPIKDVDL